MFKNIIEIQVVSGESRFNPETEVLLWRFKINSTYGSINSIRCKKDPGGLRSIPEIKEDEEF